MCPSYYFFFFFFFNLEFLLTRIWTYGKLLKNIILPENLFIWQPCNKATSTTIYLWILLMCAFRVHIKPSNFGNIFSEIEKTVNTFSIFKKIFSNISGLIWAHINRTLYLYISIYFFFFMKYNHYYLCQ